MRALKQNASAVVNGVANSGEGVTVTDRGRPVAQISPLSDSILERMLAEGLARGPIKKMRDLPLPAKLHNATGVKDLSETLEETRQGERF